MKFLEGTSVEDLNHEYVEWTKDARRTLLRGGKSGVGVYGLRSNGTRFGQHFWNHYGCNDETWPELFYEESPHSAFLLIHGELSKQ